jgi:hypothetical protein
MRYRWDARASATEAEACTVSANIASDIHQAFIETPSLAAVMT